MKTAILSLLGFLSSQVSSAQPQCKSTLPMGIRVCNFRMIGDSINCYTCDPHIVADHPDLKIISFVLTVGGEGFDDDIYEIPNQTERFSPPSINILRRIRPGSFVEISCIKAYNKAGHILYLNTFFRQL